MSAPAYQPVPTAAQQRELERWVQRKYPVRQYRDNLDESIADFRVVQLRYEERQPEPCQLGAVEDESPEGPLLRFLAICIASLGLWAAIGYAMWWVAPKVADLIAWILEMNA